MLSPVTSCQPDVWFHLGPWIIMCLTPLLMLTVAMPTLLRFETMSLFTAQAGSKSLCPWSQPGLETYTAFQFSSHYAASYEVKSIFFPCKSVEGLFPSFLHWQTDTYLDSFQKAHGHNLKIILPEKDYLCWRENQFLPTPWPFYKVVKHNEDFEKNTTLAVPSVDRSICFRLYPSQALPGGVIWVYLVICFLSLLSPLISSLISGDVLSR